MPPDYLEVVELILIKPSSMSYVVVAFPLLSLARESRRLGRNDPTSARKCVLLRSRKEHLCPSSVELTSRTPPKPHPDDNKMGR